MLIEGLSEWCQLHRRFPENVLYYRDGVSDTQYDEVITKELSTIKNAFIGVAKQFKKHVPEFKITAVIVTKRHNTRFFPRQKDDEMRGNGNCKPGLLVEISITSPYYTDFYLQSHNAIKGTARSSHYFVSQNEMGIEISHLEDLTHNLCHTYVRATTGVSYASPAYYADRLAERGRCYLREWFNPSNTKRNAYETHSQQVEADIEARRNRPQRTGNHKKTPAEIQENNADGEQVLQQMRDYIWPVVETRWNTLIHNLAESGFRPNAKAKYDHLKGTMYWM
jgi:eukaryotic translation initiation factor 2C